MNAKGANARVVATDLRRKAQIRPEQLATGNGQSQNRDFTTKDAKGAKAEKIFETQRKGLPW
jgi:hypothetical protein